MFFALRVRGPVLNQKASSRQIPHTTIRWGRPSGRVVEIQ